MHTIQAITVKKITITEALIFDLFFKFLQFLSQTIIKLFCLSLSVNRIMCFIFFLTFTSLILFIDSKFYCIKVINEFGMRTDVSSYNLSGMVRSYGQSCNFRYCELLCSFFF